MRRTFHQWRHTIRSANAAAEKFRRSMLLRRNWQRWWLAFSARVAQRRKERVLSLLASRHGIDTSPAQDRHPAASPGAANSGDEHAHARSETHAADGVIGDRGSVPMVPGVSATIPNRLPHRDHSHDSRHPAAGSAVVNSSRAEGGQTRNYRPGSYRELVESTFAEVLSEERRDAQLAAQIERGPGAQEMMTRGIQACRTRLMKKGMRQWVRVPAMCVVVGAHWCGVCGSQYVDAARALPPNYLLPCRRAVLLFCLHSCSFPA